jgi:uncharacterized protein (TIGR02246 family)
MTEGVERADRELIERYFAAMRVGAAASEDVLDLFAEDAVYVEPFGGTAATHRGRDAIRRSFRASQQHAPPDMTLSLDQLELEGDRIRTVWTCTSPGLPGPMRGQDLWTIRDGQILRLETSFLPPTPP